MAARMVDAQAPGIARRLKVVATKIGVGRDWGLEVADEIGNLTLLIEATRRAEVFDDAGHADLRSVLGVPLRKEDVHGEKVADCWDVLGQATELEDRVTTCRSWLRGRGTGRWAMHLAFTVAGQSSDLRLSPGAAITAEVEFYPSAWPQRVLIAEAAPTGFAPLKMASWDEAVERTADALAAQPWIDQIPVGLAQARLALEEGKWWAVDTTGAAFPIAKRQPWELLAMSGNEPFELFGEFDGIEFVPLGAWGEWGFLAL
jgi:hypothetical protein